MRHFVIAPLLVLLALASGAFAQTAATLPDEVYTTPGPHVVVNGVLLNAPVQQAKGALLLPMRAVFEALQAEVRWFPAAQQITAKRGDTTVQLWINRAVAIINDREIPLATPPTLVGGITYVPLRFPAEAFGGDVKWLGGQLQTAVITITPLQATTPAPPVTPPVTPPATPAQPTTTSGVVMSTNTDIAQAFVYQDAATGNLGIVQITATVQLLRGTSATQLKPATLADMQAGDQVEIVRDAAGKLTTVRVFFQTVVGRMAAIANGKLLMQDGTLYQLKPDVRVVDTAGKTLALADLQGDREVTLQVTPGTTMVSRITAPPVVIAVAPTRPAEVLAVGPVDYTHPLKAGDTLTIIATGTPKAERALARIGTVVTDIMLTEKEAGQYKGTVTIPANTNVTDAPIVASLQVDGRQTADLHSTTRVTIDTVAPRFDALLPGQNALLTDRNPTFNIAFSDPGGSGIDPAKVVLKINNIDVSKTATITAQGISYQAKDLPLAAIPIYITIADKAGNVATAQWKITVQAGRTVANILAVTHDATQPLKVGQTIRATAKLRIAPARLEWYLGSKRISEAKTAAAGTMDYTMTYTIATDDVIGEQPLSVRFFTAANTSETAVATTPVTIVATTRPLKITAPANKSKAEATAVITGEATPGAKVRVTVTYTKLVLILMLNGEVYQGNVVTGADGTWKTPTIDMSVPNTRPDSYTITADVLDEANAVKETATITLTK